MRKSWIDKLVPKALRSRSVACEVSTRWLQFGEQGSDLPDGEYIHLDVMTAVYDDDGGEKPRKLCSLVITRENIERALANVSSPPSRPRSFS